MDPDNKEPVTLVVALSWMVSMILGRAHIGIGGNAAAWSTIIVGSASVFFIPPRIARVVQLWIESAQRIVFIGSKEHKHIVIITGLISLCRIR